MLLAVLLVLPGAACVSTNTSTRPQLPVVPEELRTCFAGVADLPAQAEWDAETTAKALVRVRTSELAKTDCGKRLLAFYDRLRTGLR